MQTMLDAMVERGLEPYTSLPPADDGKLVRFRVRGDKAGSQNGWAVHYSHPIRSGAFGSWKTGEVHKWCEASTTPMTPAQRAEMRKQLDDVRQVREAVQQKVQADARAKAKKLWETARPATNKHPYLEKKGIGAYGIRQLRSMLLVPARDLRGTLQTIQFISPDGSKRFLTGGRIAGCYYAIGKPAESLLVCEGYATGATLHAATGRAVAVCFSAGNMVAVARELRLKFPGQRLIMCADNDHRTPGNPGVASAVKAAWAVGGLVAVPNFAGVRHE